MTAEKRLTRAALALFLLSVGLSLLLLRRPNYGGDEVWFATPLIRRSVSDLELFQFEYAGAVKTLITGPIFAIAGFSIVSVRLFTLMTFVVMVGAWCAYLQRRALPIAAAATLIFFALHADLQFFARVDINQPTVHDLWIVLHLLAFLAIVEHGPRPANVLAFLVLSFIDVNNHVRNVWVANGLLLAFVVDHVSMHGISRQSAVSAIRRGWPVALGWGVAALVFARVLVHYDGSVGLEAAKALGKGFTWKMRADQVAEALPQLVSGGRVLAVGYGAGPTSIVAGVVILLATLASLISVPRVTASCDFGIRLLRMVTVAWLAVMVQYAATKSAQWPWHGNSVMLFWAATFGLLIQSLWTSKRGPAIAYAGLVFVMLGAYRVTLERSIERAIAWQSGFALGVWNSQCIDQVRAYVHAHPAHYVFSDWSIGRALTLELKYRPRSGTTATLYDGWMPDEAIQGIHSDQVVLRAVGVAVTVPDVSDGRIERLGKIFQPLVTFGDVLGREAYQLGHIVTPEGASIRGSDIVPLHPSGAP